MINKYFLLTLVLSGLVSISYQQQSTVENDAVAGAKSADARLNRYIYRLSVLTALNSTLRLKSLNDTKTNLWLLTRTNSNKTSLIDPIYDVATPDLRNESVRNRYSCLPTESNCAQLSINQFQPSDIGVFSLTARSNDYMSDYLISYNVSMFLAQPSIQCGVNEKCLFNATTQTLSVVADSSIQMSCSINVVQDDMYKPAAQLKVYSDTYGEECTNAQTQYEQLPSSLLNLNGINLVTVKLNKQCTRSFVKQEFGKSFSCMLDSVYDSQVPDGLQTRKTYEKLVLKLDVQYGPDLQPGVSYNKTLIVNTNTMNSFSCPFTGNPDPIYYWRVADVKTNNQTKKEKRLLTPTDFATSSKEYVIPNNLQIGLYVFECKAQMQGLLSTTSQVVRFYLNVIGNLN
jgi:hypothetical protein